MISRFQQLAIFNRELRDKLLIIDPAHAPALNMFDYSAPRYAKLTADEREDLQVDVVALFNYVFEGYALTPQMATAFEYAVQLTLQVPRGTIDDLRKILSGTRPLHTVAAWTASIQMRMNSPAPSFIPRAWQVLA